MRFFTRHLNDVNEGYFEHMGHAGWYGWRMLCAGFACIAHATCPFMFQETASKCIRELYDHMAKRGRHDELEEDVWLEFNI